jgi:hypothetical protein
MHSLSSGGASFDWLAFGMPRAISPAFWAEFFVEEKARPVY